MGAKKERTDRTRPFSGVQAIYKTTRCVREAIRCSILLMAGWLMVVPESKSSWNIFDSRLSVRASMFPFTCLLDNVINQL